MLQNFFKIAVRGLFQNKVYTFVNLAGLSFGLTVVMLIMLYVKDDLSFDRVHTQGNRIYRLVQRVKYEDGSERKIGKVGLMPGPIFKAEMPEVEAFCRIKNGFESNVKKGNEGIKAKVLYADASILSMFSYQILQGNAATALNNKDKVVLTEQAAIKYFGTNNALGKTLLLNDGISDFKPFEISAVLATPPNNTSIQFDVLLSFQHKIPTIPEELIEESKWYYSDYNVFVLLKPNIDETKLQSKIDKIVKKHTGDYDETAKVFEDKKGATQYFFQPFFQMHLDAEYFATDGLENWSNALYPKILSALALLILLIACINFINLTLARSLKRSKEIGIRKVTGSSRKQLIVQFLGESLLMTCLAFLPSLALVETLLPIFAKLTNKHLEVGYIFEPFTLFMFGLLLLVVAFLAGFYPALVMSGLNITKSLKGQLKLSGRNLIGKSLVIFQFVIAAVLMVGMAVLNLQFNFIKKTDLGYKTANILRFHIPMKYFNGNFNTSTFKENIAKQAFVKQVSANEGGGNMTRFTINKKSTDDVNFMVIDENYLQMLQIPLLSGRFLSFQHASDSTNSIIVNESFIKAYIPPGQDPFKTMIGYGDKDTKTIVGIVKDFHHRSFKEKISPMMFRMTADSRFSPTQIHIEIDGQHKREALANILKVYRSFIPFQPFDYQFLDDFRMEKYANDLRWKTILTYTSLIAFLISCLGLFGLASLNIEQRTKEIGVRKVLGASVANISTMLSKEFLKLVFIGFVIALPASWYLADWWLKDFVYKINLGWAIFALVGVLMLTVAGITIAYQTIKAANANPVDNLRME